MFWKRPSISDNTRFWVDESFDWFDARFTPPSMPILPTKEYFNAPRGTDPKTARLVLDDIQRLLQLDDKIELHPIGRLNAEYRHTYQALSETQGTFEIIDGQFIINYDPEQMNAPLHFINTMAHEAMHARLAHLVNDAPGGADAHEMTTDLGCIIAGFGVFQLQTADDAGWSGYLRQSTRAYALALFLQRRNLDITTVTPYLSKRCTRLLRTAFKEVS